MTIQKKTATCLSQPIKKAPFNLKGVVRDLGHFCFGLFILISLFAAAQHLTYVYALSIPAAILGIAVLFVTLIALNCVPKSILFAGKPLLAHMSLFFLPAIVAIVNYLDLLRLFPIALLLAIVVTTLISLAITAWLAQWLMKSLLVTSQTTHKQTPQNNQHD